MLRPQIRQRWRQPVATIFRALITGTLDRSASIQENAVGIFKTQTQALGNLFNGNEGSLRVDYNWNANNRTFLSYNYTRETDSHWPLPDHVLHARFHQPQRGLFPAGSFSWVHTFSPTS